MCVICHHIPCASGCPNAPDPEPVEQCVECKGDIYAGDRFWDSPEGPVCEDCLDSMSAEDVLEYMGMSVREMLDELGEVMQEAEEKDNEW